MCCENCCDCYQQDADNIIDAQKAFNILEITLIKYREYFYINHQDNIVDIFDELMDKAKNLQYYLD